MKMQSMDPHLLHGSILPPKVAQSFFKLWMERLLNHVIAMDLVLFLISMATTTVMEWPRANNTGSSARGLQTVMPRILLGPFENDH